ncbi:MAG: hypothetical protein KDA78_19165, partial [Planctomycetaceae bacterium]|nr:hypothetical protein [Planctomycetaceae bacterium]
MKSLNDGQLLGMLRAYALTMIRLESPEIAAREQITQRLSALLPHENDDVNVELVRVLVALNDSSIIERVLTLMESDRGNEPPAWSELISRNAQYGGTIQGMLDNAPPTRQINYALMLR